MFEPAQLIPVLSVLALCILCLLLGYILCYLSISTYTSSARNAMRNLEAVNRILRGNLYELSTKIPVPPGEIVTDTEPSKVSRTDEDEADIEQGRMLRMLEELDPALAAQVHARSEKRGS